MIQQLYPFLVALAAFLAAQADAHAATPLTPAEMRQSFAVTAQVLLVSDDGKRVVQPVGEMRKWAGMNAGGEFRQEWMSSDSEIGEFRLRQTWRIGDSGAMTLAIEEFKADNPTPTREEFTIAALTPVMYPLKSRKNAIIRFIPDFIVAARPQDFTGQPLVTRGATLFDREGGVWATDLETDHPFVGFKTRLGTVALSYTKFAGAQANGIATGSQIDISGADIPKLVLQSRSAIVPEGVHAVVYTRILPLAKTSALNSVRIFESTTKPRFEEKLQPGSAL